MDERIPVGVLAATGSVGQRFVQLLDGHPWFRVAALTGSERSQGHTYGEACRWILPEPMPGWARELPVLPTEVGEVQAPILFSALPAEAARQVEPDFARAGSLVCSNASAFRMAPDVPILLPEVNPEHLGVLERQRQERGWPGGIVTNSNCTSTGLTIVLGALQAAFSIRRAFVVSLQALSGAGYPGVAALDSLDNVIPYIPGEEEKVELEARKMLGRLGPGGLELSDFSISAHTNRVAVSDGHLVCLSVELGQKVGVSEAARVLAAYRAPEASRELPSAPRPVILVKEEPDRPQPRLDRMEGKGMTTVVGRLRPDPVFHLKMVILSHNTIRGAAGGSLYNAELLVKEGYLPKHTGRLPKPSVRLEQGG
jgi:aspartate-semialdehyde dehydrogenase